MRWLTFWERCKAFSEKGYKDISRIFIDVSRVLSVAGKGNSGNG